MHAAARATAIGLIVIGLAGGALQLRPNRFVPRPETESVRGFLLQHVGGRDDVHYLAGPTDHFSFDWDRRLRGTRHSFPRDERAFEGLLAGNHGDAIRYAVVAEPGHGRSMGGGAGGYPLDRMRRSPLPSMPRRTAFPMAFPILIDEPTLQRRIRDLAAPFAASASPPYLVAVLDGARPFAEAFCRCLGRPGDFDRVKLASYGKGTTSGGVVRLERDLKGDVTGRRVVILEDIVDTGRTVDFLMQHMQERGAASVEVVTLLSKPSRRAVQVPLSGVGFEIPDQFVIGFGMDLAGAHRDLPYVGVWVAASAAHA